MSVMRVAKAANVSHTTVSRVINRDPAVTPKLAAQVFKAMREAGNLRWTLKPNSG